MQKIRILVDCHVFDGNFQGTTTYLKGLYSEILKDNNYQIYLAARNTDNLKQIFGANENVVYVKYTCKNKFFRLLFDIPKIIKENKIDYTHFQYVVAPFKKGKYIVTIHDVLFLEFPEYFPLLYRIKNKLLFNFSAKRSESVFTVSEYSKIQLKKHLNIDSEITPNSVDPVYFEEYDKKKVSEDVLNKFKVSNYFLYVSRWEPRKNHHNLLKIFVENKYYDKYSLVFVGDKAIKNQKYLEYYTALTEEIKSKIFVFNKVEFDDLLLLVRGAKLSIYPSIAEGFGIPPLESLAANVPTICSNTTAMSDFDFFDECLFDPLDLVDFKNKVEIGLKETLVEKKKSRMAMKYNWKYSAEQLKKAFL